MFLAWITCGPRWDHPRVGEKKHKIDLATNVAAYGGIGGPVQDAPRRPAPLPSLLTACGNKHDQQAKQRPVHNTLQKITV